MSLFGCRGCEARDKEILHLLAQLNAQREHTTKLAAQLCEIAAPGSTRRAVPAPQIAATAPVVKARAEEKTQPKIPAAYLNMPGYERRKADPALEIV